MMIEAERASKINIINVKLSNFYPYSLRYFKVAFINIIIATILRNVIKEYAPLTNRYSVD